MTTGVIPDCLMCGARLSSPPNHKCQARLAFNCRRRNFRPSCPGPNYNASTCPQHTAGALPDFTRTLISTYLGQKMLSNTIQLQADITKRISGRIGYMYEDRVITDTGYFGGTVDYYEATNHIPPYANATYYP